MKMYENEWKQEDKVEIAAGWNTTRYRHTYDPLGEVFFFAAGPFFKDPVFLATAFAFGRGLLRDPSSSSLSPSSRFCFTIHFGVVGETVRRPTCVRLIDQTDALLINYMLLCSHVFLSSSFRWMLD